MNFRNFPQPSSIAKKETLKTSKVADVEVIPDASYDSTILCYLSNYSPCLLFFSLKNAKTQLMRGRAVGIDKTMKRLKNKTCGDCPLVNSAGPCSLHSDYRLAVPK